MKQHLLLDIYNELLFLHILISVQVEKSPPVSLLEKGRHY